MPLITYAMLIETTTGIGPRVSLLAIALFSAAVNLIDARDDLGAASGLTLVDKIYFAVLVSILIAAVVTVASRLLVERGWETADVARLNDRLGAIVAALFVAINALLIAVAVRGG